MRTGLLFLAYALLGAHFLRYEGVLLALLLALLPCLCFLRRKWAVILLQLGLVAGSALVWLPTIVNIAQMRMAMGAPWVRMAVILSAVIVFSLAVAFGSKGLYKHKK